MIKLELSIEEVNAIIGVMGELPTKSGAWPLIMKIKDQAESQLPPPVESVDESKPADPE